MQFDASPTDHLQAPVNPTPHEQAALLRAQGNRLFADLCTFLQRIDEFLQRFDEFVVEKRQVEEAYLRMIDKEEGDKVVAEYESGGRPSPEREQERAARQRLAYPNL